MKHCFLKRLVFLSLFGFMGTCLAAAEMASVYPHKIIALSPHTVELLFAIGAGDRIVGTTEASDYPQKASAITRVGGHHGLQLETIVELDPDLILAWQGGNKASDIKRLEDLGLRVHRGNTKALDDIAFEVRELGRLTGLSETAEVVALDFEGDLKQLRDTYQSRQPVSFFYQLWAKPLRSIAPASWINDVMTGCGGRNIVPNVPALYPEVSMESVLISAPEIIFQPSVNTAKVPSNDVWQKWPEIPAVANQHIYSIDADLLHRFSLRILDGMQQICEKIELVRK